MRRIVVEISGLRFGITYRYDRVTETCRDYIVKDGGRDAGMNGDVYEIKADGRDIEKEIRAASERGGENGIPGKDAAEALAVFRRIAELLPLTGRFLMHGSAVSLDGEGYLFTAPSGTGKSTHASFWKEQFRERAVMVNDDKPFIRVSDGNVFVCGSPWTGKHRRGTNVQVPLKAVCILRRGAGNRIRPSERGEYYPELLGQIYRPAAPEALASTLTLVDAMLEKVPAYVMECNTDPSAALTAYVGMN